MFEPGDRVRWSTEDDEGLPWSRYGFVAAVDPNGYAFVLFDGELKNTTCVPIHELVLVSVTAIELRLSGCDLLDEPGLRQGLVSLWSAEADEAGLDIDEISPRQHETARAGLIALAELTAGGRSYQLRASAVTIRDEVWVRAQPHGLPTAPSRHHLLNERRADGVGGPSV